MQQSGAGMQPICRQGFLASPAGVRGPCRLARPEPARQIGAMAEIDPRPAEAAAGSFERRVPAGDNRSRLVCRECGFIAYENPKVVVGSVCTWQDRILLCRRAINPRSGFWTLPAGYMELHETSADGAKREAWEEAQASIEIERLLAVYNIPRLSQVQLIYGARLLRPQIAAGPESAEVRLFAWEEIPWDEIAFPSARWALNHHRTAASRPDYPVQFNPPGELGNYEQGL
jgi:ADP-ribose pyrophosphatase YjhB (NUDIX family)